jgi:hypothetical protein
VLAKAKEDIANKSVQSQSLSLATGNRITPITHRILILGRPGDHHKEARDGRGEIVAHFICHNSYGIPGESHFLTFLIAFCQTGSSIGLFTVYILGQ